MSFDRKKMKKKIYKCWIIKHVWEEEENEEGKLEFGEWTLKLIWKKKSSNFKIFKKIKISRKLDTPSLITAETKRKTSQFEHQSSKPKYWQSLISILDNLFGLEEYVPVLF